MRIFKSAIDAQKEILRDLVEMGIENKSYSYQDKLVFDNDNFVTRELINYSYCLTKWKDLDKLNGLTKEWADAEFKERISGEIKNPGEAWKLREEVWDEFLHDGKFAYTYNERISSQIGALIWHLINIPTSRQGYLQIFNSDKDYKNLGGSGRVPCSLGYYFMIRGNKLNMVYTMRSCDLFTHWANDVYLAIKLLEHVAEQINIEPERFFHNIFSLHAFKKDWGPLGVF